MSGVSGLQLTRIGEMGIQEMMSMLEDHGYDVALMSNEEIYDMCLSIFDGHQLDGDPGELSFDS